VSLERAVRFGTLARSEFAQQHNSARRRADCDRMRGFPEAPPEGALGAVRDRAPEGCSVAISAAVAADSTDAILRLSSIPTLFGYSVCEHIMNRAATKNSARPPSAPLRPPASDFPEAPYATIDCRRSAKFSLACRRRSRTRLRFRKPSTAEIPHTAGRSRRRPRGLRPPAAFPAAGLRDKRGTGGSRPRVGEHDLARQSGDFGRIVVFAQCVQVVQMAHEGRVRLLDQAGELGAGAPRQRHEFIRCGLDDRHALDCRDLWWPLQGFGDERRYRQLDGNALQRPHGRFYLDRRALRPSPRRGRFIGRPVDRVAGFVAGFPVSRIVGIEFEARHRAARR
jgi:hypothetical protein